MATGDIIDQVKPRDFFGGNGITDDYCKPRLAGVMAGHPLRKTAGDDLYFWVRVPANGTPLSTGLTFKVVTVDDPNNTSAGLIFRLGISGVKVITATTALWTAGTPPTGPTFGTETTSDVTANATAGIITETSMAITTANLNTPVAGNNVLIRLRRLGTHANDTHQGVPLVVNVVVTDT